MIAAYALARRIAASTVVALTCALLGGCVAGVSSRPYTGSEDGYRYALPQPVLVAKPKTDGTVTFDWAYPPDEGATYVVDEYSFLANNTLDVTLENGTLKKFSLDANTSAVAAAALGAAGDVAKVRLDTQAQADTARATEKKAATDKIAQAQSALQAAQAKLDALEELRKNPLYASEITPAKLLDAQLEARTKQAAYDALVGAARPIGGIASGDMAGSSTDTSVNNGKPCSADKAWGPVFYRVHQWIDDKDHLPTVQLVALADANDRGQDCFATTVLVPPPAPKSPQALHFVIEEPGSLVQIPPNKRGRLLLKVTGNRAYGELVPKSGRITAVRDGGYLGEQQEDPKLDPRSERTEIRVHLPRSLKPGKYELSFEHRTPASAAPVLSNSIEFEVERP